MIPDPKAMRKAIMIAKSIASKVDPNFGRVSMPGVDQVLERADGGGVDRLNMHYKDVTQRIPQLTEAAGALSRGEMTSDDYRNLVNQHKPVTPYASVPQPATHDEMYNALAENKREKLGALGDYPEGHPVALRLDIPAYTHHGVWVPTIHDQASGKTIAHASEAHISDPVFEIPQNKALAVASGRSKSPFATINGNLKKTSPEDIHEMARAYLNHPEWRQVGMDPERHSHFYDRETQQPITHADEAIQVGPLVLAKNPRYGKEKDYLYAGGGHVEDHGKTVPESPRTLELQRQMLMQGKRKAMLYTPGTPIPPPIHGIVGVRTPQGVIHYNPNLISHEEVVHAAQNNRLNEILGLGPYSKRDVEEKVAAGEPLLAVVSRDHIGHEAVAAAGTPSTAHEQLAALHEHVPEGGSVSVEPFDHVVSQRAQGGEVDPITAYHGSANDFDEFSTEHKGEGFGLSAFGHGLNFAEDEGVAKIYRQLAAKSQGDMDIKNYTGDILPEDHPATRLIKDFYRTHSGGEKDQAQKWRRWASDQDQQIKEYEEYNKLNGGIDDDIAEMRQKQGELRDAADALEQGYRGHGRGHMYEVELHADPNKMIHWHEPLEKQPENVQRMAAELGVAASAKGKDIYDKAVNRHQVSSNPNMPHMTKTNYEALNQHFADHDIQGIKWKASDSRVAPSWDTHNYTIWEPKRVGVKRKYALGGDVEPEHMAVGGDAGENPLMKTFSQENAPSVIVSPRPGEGGGPPISPEKGFSYNPELESDHEPWNFSTPNIMGAAKPPSIQHPTMNQPRLKNIADSTGKIFKTKGFQDLAHSLTGLRGITATPTMGTWKNKAEPSFILHHPDMTDEHAHTLANVLGFGFQQDAAVQTKHNPDSEEGIQTLLIGHDKKLQKGHIDRMLDAAKDHGLDFTVTKDGKAAKFMHFGDESELPDFIDKVSNIADRSGLKHRLSVQTQGDLIHAKDYLPNIFSKASAQQGLLSGSEGSPDIFRGIVNHVLAPYAKSVAGEGYRLSPDRLAEAYGLSDEQREHVRGALYPSKGADQSTVPLMTGEENLDVRPTGDRGKSTVGDALYALQNRAAQKGQIEPGDFSDRAKDQISNNIVKEVAYHVKNSDKSAIGWYDAALKKAMEEHSNNFPELKTDPNKQLLFKAILGITSQGNDVFSNSNHTARLYNRITRDGMSIPEAVKNLNGTFGDKTRAIESNLLKFHHLVENNGYDGIRDMFNQTKTVGEWNKILRQNNSLRGPDGSPLSMQGGSDQKVTGWMVFGPKIGSFINNLNGDYSTLTADLWFSRTWNRLLGHNFDHTPMAEAKQYREFRDALRGEFHGTSPDSPYLDGNPFGAKTSEGKPNIKANGEPEPWLMGPDARELSHDDYEKTLNDPEKMLEYAKEIHGRYKGGGYKVKSDLRRRAKNWIENREVPVGAPRGDRERSFQQDTVEQAQKTLKKNYGLNISVADIQAALWFHEKELFGKLGVASEKAQPADYHDAAISTSKLIKSGDLYKVKSKEKKSNLPPDDQVFARGGLVDKALRIVASKVR